MKIILSTNREINYSEDENIQGENNATIIYFEFPEKISGIDINELNKYIVFNLEGISPQLIENNQYTITDALTQKETLEAQIYIKRGKDLLFKSEIFELDFGKSLEINYTVTLDDLDIIDSLIRQYEELNEKFNSEVTNLISLEQSIQTAENLRASAETNRNLKFQQLEQDLLAAINSIKDLTSAYNLNAESKIKEFNSNYDTQIANFNANVTNKTTDFDNNATTKKEEFNNNVEEKTNSFNTTVQTAKDDINTIKTTAVTEVNTAKETAKAELEAINDENTQKIENLENNKLDKDDEIISWLGTVKENYDSDKIENAIRNYFALTQDDGVYTVRFPLWDTSNTSQGEKLDKNADKYLNLATDTIYEDTNYGEAFRTYDCNAYVDDNGVRHITALKGMDNFEDTGEVDVFVLIRTYWEKIYEKDGYMYYSRTYTPKEGFTPVKQAINKDGTISPWFVIAKYVTGYIKNDAGTKYFYSSKGLKPARYISTPVGVCVGESDDIHYANNISRFKKRGKYYTAGLMADYKHIKTTIWLKFATKNSQSVIMGNTNYNFQYMVSQAEENVSRVILTTAQAANLEINTFVSVGEMGENTNKDRAYGYMHSLANDVEIIGKEIIDDAYTALILDCEPFTTTLTTCVSTMHEHSGYSDFVLGRNGSRVSNTNGHHGAVIDGIECFVGGYEVPANTFMNLLGDDYTREVYITNDATKLTNSASNAMATYTKLETIMKTTGSNAWKYITEEYLDLENGISYPTSAGESGSGSSVGYADGYFVDTGTSGQREFLLLGGLATGAVAGVSIVRGSSGFWNAYWSVLARLSINAVGGELAE